MISDITSAELYFTITWNVEKENSCAYRTSPVAASVSCLINVITFFLFLKNNFFPF